MANVIEISKKPDLYCPHINQICLRDKCKFWVKVNNTQYNHNHPDNGKHDECLLILNLVNNFYHT